MAALLKRGYSNNFDSLGDEVKPVKASEIDELEEGVIEF